MNARNKAIMVGGVIGALLGLLAAWIYVRDLPEGEEQETQLPAITPGDALKLGLTALGLLRQIAGLRE
jgi:hypothetical protein